MRAIALPSLRSVICRWNQSKKPWRKAPLWNQSSPRQPSTIGHMGTATLSAGCGCTSPISVVKPGYDDPVMPTRPLLSGTCFTSQSIVSQVSVE